MRIRARLATRTAACAAGVLGLVLSVGVGPAGAADGGLSKTFKDHNFQLTLPTAEWQFEEVLEENLALGIVAAARRTVSPGVEVSVMVRVVDSAGASLDSLMSQVRDKKTELVGDIVQSALEPASWAGVRASQLTLKGKYPNGSIALFRVYGAVVEGKFHEFSMRIMNRAEETIAKEIDAVVEGYRFLKGGTPPRPEGGTPAPGGEAPGGGDSGMEGGDGSAPPPAEPGDATARKFPNLALTWRLPKAPDAADKPTWKWGTDGKTDIKRTETGLAGVMVLVQPDDTRPMSVELYVQPAKSGTTPERIVNDMQFQDDIAQKNFSSTPIPKIDEDVKIGNAHGAGIAETGKDKNDPPRPMQLRMYFVILKRTVFQVVLVAREGAEKTFKAEARAALDGLAWDDATEGLRGPLASPIETDTEKRGDYVDKEYPVRVTKAHGFTLTKPVGFAMLKFDGTNPDTQYHDHQVLWFAAEGRKKDAYCFFSVSTYFAKDFMDQRPPKDPESLVDDVEGAWKNVVSEPVTRPKGEKASNRTTGAFNGAHGSTYEFRGNVRSVPYLERGWMVKSGQNWYLIREQFGGKDAEAAFADDLKAMTKTVKFE